MPAAYVLATQALAVGWFCLVGSWAGALARPHVGPLAAGRVALWTGLLVAALAVLVTGLFTALRGPVAVLALAVVTAGCALAWLLVRRRRARVDDPPADRAPAITRAWWVAVPIGALVLVSAVVAHLAFGPVGNYDTGLYHLGVIGYAQDYPTIHGLANLHSRFGTNVSAFSLAAFGANTGWGPDAYRLVVGLFVLVLSTDLALRLLDGRPGTWRRPGTYVLLLGLAAAFPALLGLAPAAITSPSPDALALVPTLAAGAYLADALVTRDRTWTALALVTAALAASVRTQLWVAFAVTVAVLVADRLRRRGERPGPRALPTVGAVLAGLTIVVMLVRDTLLSGWLLFPATYLPMPVPWRVPRAGAESTRDWIMSWARDAAAGPDQTLTSWYWLGSWARSTAADWSVATAVGLLALALLAYLATRPRPGRRAGGRADRRTGRRWPIVAAAVAPSALAVVAWFATAPDPRFAWGSILLLGALPAAFALAHLRARATVGVVASGLLVVALVPGTLATAAAVSGDPGGEAGSQVRTYSFGPLTTVAAVAAVPIPVTEPFTVADGRTVVVPVESERCWAVFPACTPYRDPTLRFLGPSVADGFAGGGSGN